MRAIPLLYNVMWTVAAPFLLPLLIAMRWAKGEKPSHMCERLAVLPSSIGRQDAPVWCHAISVGELNALFPVVRTIAEHDPSRPLLITTQTVAGLKIARQRFPFARATLYAPLDHPWIVRRFVQHTRPSVLLVMETGYWPNMLRLARSHGALCILAQARMSEKSFRHWSRFPGISRWLLNFFHHITVENSSMFHKLVALGADSKRIHTVPNTKFDTMEIVPEQERSRLRQRLGIGQDDLVLIAGSTHPGEERVLAEAYGMLRSAYPRIILILAPRRLERLDQVRWELAQCHLSWQNWTDLAAATRSSNVILLDTMGELARFYSIATAAFVGSSLFPPGGGHSLLEPAAQGVSILHGPCIQNSALHADQLQRLGVAHLVHDAKEIRDQVHLILKDPQESRMAASRAQQWVQSQRGGAAMLAKLVLTTVPTCALSA